VILCVDRFLPEFDLLSNEVYHIQTFLAVSASLTDRQVSAIFPESPLMVWDSDLIYQYFRLTGDNRLLLGASSPRYTYGNEHRGVVPRILGKMRAMVRRKFPHTPLDLEYFWPGMIGVSKDLLPLAGRDPARQRRSAGTWRKNCNRIVPTLTPNSTRAAISSWDPRCSTSSGQPVPSRYRTGW
jgi:gamma-glutamylputrescine oxidase